jgi:hypothetical protein
MPLERSNNVTIDARYLSECIILHESPQGEEGRKRRDERAAKFPAVELPMGKDAHATENVSAPGTTA